ncbi:hypothetical protein JW964_25215 [candidate division KSB1 bacterium]|nr:hypothetical protein [candidate division KSB1 bacterium]
MDYQVKKNKLLYDLETRKIYSTDVPEQQIVEFLDVVTGKPRRSVHGKGIVNNKISAQLLNYLGSYQLPTHFIKTISENEMLVKVTEKLPLECHILNVATKFLNEKFGIPWEKELDHPIFEYHTNDKLGNRVSINETHIVALNILKADEMRYIKHLVSKANVVLKSFFARRDFKLVEFKLSFGCYKNYIIIQDDLSLDSIHIWDLRSDIHFESEFFTENHSEMTGLLSDLQQRILGD